MGTESPILTYTYGDEEWGDLLTSYDGSSIQYDAMGNPLNDGKWSYEWEHGRQLASMLEVWHPELEITAHPESYTGEAGGTAAFSVEANGAYSYQWQYSNNGSSAWWSSSMEGSNTASISVQATEARAGNLYRCKVTDTNGNTIYSDPAQIDLGGSYDLAILAHPRYYTGAFGQTAVFGISARGEEITYQWQYSTNGGNAWWNSSMDGSDTPYMSVAFTEARQNYLYRCKITDTEGNTRYSAPAGFYLAEHTWEYTYHTDGMRTGRTDGKTTYSYIYNGSQLSQMTVGSNTLTFAYDTNGKPLTVTLNGAVYYYATNLQGDVTGIWDANGNRVAAYTYDAWGNFTVESDDPIAAYNPLTYRGYVYDLETELYYLQSRHYDPQVGRFINEDGLIATGQGLLGNNMFAYCAGNPVVYSDTFGTARSYCVMLTDTGGKHNSLIYRQDASPCTELTYGKYSASYNSCGVVATYNTLVLKGFSGYENSFSSILEDFEELGYPLFNGYFGTWPTSIGEYFTRRGIESSRWIGFGDPDVIVEPGSIVIVSIWFENPFEGMYTFACARTKTGWDVYNRHYLDRASTYKTFEDILESDYLAYALIIY